MPVNYTVYKKYFQACENNDKTPSLEEFITKHHVFVKNTFEKSSESLKAVWNEFQRAATLHSIKVKKGKASMAWKKFV